GILDNGDLKCWGADSRGQLGDGWTNAQDSWDYCLDAPPSTPIDLGTGRTAVAVSSGTFHTCAILDNGDLTCWGGDHEGQVGDDGDNTDQDSPVSVDLGTGRTAVAVSAHDLHTCAILDNGDLKCWGKNDYGQLGDGTASGNANGIGRGSPVLVLGNNTWDATTSTSSGCHFLSPCEKNKNEA
ncbi:MAG: hypothetical protein VXV98_10150, partial [Candidatus Thermoplasmatota archaeon]|nr:hypothetical protein [Candidatus Thermoplasmatota archaeon]